MTRPPPLLLRVVTAGADRLAERWGVPAENRAAFRQTAISSFTGMLSEAYGGDRLRIGIPLMPSPEREARRARIAAALANGEAVVVIAQRERVSAQWVRRLRRSTIQP